MGKGSSSTKIGILTAGGDCPGINAAIRGVGKTAIMKYGMKLVGISDGFTGMINKEYTELTGLETRETVLGYKQRGGTPSPIDRVLATRYGTSAADMIASRDFGEMVALRNNEIVSVPLAEVAGKLKLVDPDDPRVIQAQNPGTSYGV
jgi:6-phosphofructokinase